MKIGEIQSLPLSDPSSSAKGKAQEQRSSNQEILQAIQTIREAGGVGPNSELSLTIDRNTGQPLIKVVNKVTNEVISQIPPEAILRAAQVLRQLQEGARVG